MGSMPENDLKEPQGQLVTHIIDEKAQWMPNNTVLRYGLEDWEESGYRTMTWKQYANAVNKVAYWLDSQLGKATTCDTIGYFGPNDPRYAILLPAVMKNERKVGMDRQFSIVRH
jgi:acyl-CoA synthetase (AMP-forming)/AMP-acid ligase II